MKSWNCWWVGAGCGGGRVGVAGAVVDDAGAVIEVAATGAGAAAPVAEVCDARVHTGSQASYREL